MGRVQLFFLGLLALQGLAPGAVAQSSNAPLNRDYYHLLDRLEIRHNRLSNSYQSAVKPYTRQAIATFIDTLKADNVLTSPADHFNNNYLHNDNFKWTANHQNLNPRPIWNTLYKYRSDFLYGADKKEAIVVHFNPVLNLGIGGETADGRYTYLNTRGAQIHGMIDGKVGFYAYLGENQMRPPTYVRQFISQYTVVPHEGFWKTFGDQGYDFFTATGYISFNATRHINFQFGHDRQFWGDGYRSLILSDFSPPALFLRINTRVWRINYTNLFTQIYADAYGQSGGSIGNTAFPKKYLIAHRLSFDIGRHVTLAAFESVVFGREDSLGNNHFELSYLNPIIFYRALEQQNGSLDNALLGLDAKWNFLGHFSLYGQFVFDELKVGEFFKNPGWWGNKFSYQLGLKYIDVLNVSNLDLQLEYNWARPYTYTHSTIYSNYTNYRQPVAHPLGANFREFIAVARYQPLPRLSLTGKLFVANYGLDSADTNYGKEILKDYTTRVSDEGNFVGQGIATNWLLADFRASYMFWHNTFVDFNIAWRQQESAADQYDQRTLLYSLTLRWNAPFRLHEF